MLKIDSITLPKELNEPIFSFIIKTLRHSFDSFFVLQFLCFR